MPLVLQILLSVSIVTLTVLLALLLLQARRTATSVQRLADQATLDLHQVAEDVHEVRQRIDEVTRLATSALEVPSLLSQIVTGLARAVPEWIRPKRSSGHIVEALLAGLLQALHFLRGRSHGPQEEASDA